MAWRYIAQRLLGDGSSGDFLDFDVPLKGVNITDNLSGNNVLSGTIAPQIARLIGSDGDPIFKEWSSALWAEEDGHIRGGGILTHSGFVGHEWNVETVGYTGYLADLPYTGSRFFVEADPLDIFRHIWDHVQSQPGGNLGLEVTNTKSPVRIGKELEQAEFDTQSGPVAFESGPYKLAWYQTHDLSEDAVKLSSDTPFDWWEHHDWDGDVIRHRLKLGYPQLGTKRTDLRFVIDENVSEIPSVDRDGTGYATEVLALGAGEGAAMIRGSSSRKRTGLRRVAVVSDPSLRTIRAANTRAQQEMAWRADLDDISDLRVRDSSHAPVGSVTVGDEIYVEGDTGWKDLNNWVRVLSRTIAPDDGDYMQLSVARTDKLG